MKIVKFSIKRPITIFMGVLIVLMFGAVSYFKLNIDMLPTFNLPMLMLITNYNGAGPEEIERLVTKPLESIIGTTSNVEGVNSVSSDGKSMLMIEFADGTDMDFASLEIREKLDMITDALPNGVGKPMIMKMDPNMMPIMSFAINCDGMDIDKLSEFASKSIVPVLERIDGVASVDMVGDSKNEIKILVDQDKLNANGLTMNNISSAIKSDNINMPIGSIVEGSYDLLVRSTSEITSVSDVENILITNREGKIFKLKDLATIVLGKENKTNFARLNGQDALIFSIQKESMSNTVAVSKDVRKELEDLKTNIDGFGSTMILDQAEFIEFAINSVKMNAIIGAVLAILVIFMFLKDIRSTIIMAVSIPISVIATFIMVYFAGFTLNMISLGGIALGVGMLVDNSIVVIENIYRLRKNGLDSINAAIKGTIEVTMAIIASTLTSICVFLPIVFVEGMASEIFKEMAFTVTFSLVSSLIISFTLVPLLASILFKKDIKIKENKLLEKIKDKYKVILLFCLNKKRIVFIILVLSIGVGAFAFLNVGFELFPSTDQGVVTINVETAKGFNISSINDISNKVLTSLDGIEEIKDNAVTINKNGANFSVLLNEKRDRTDKEVAREIREKVSNIAGANIEVVAMSGGISTNMAPISIQVEGEEFEQINEITNEVVKALEKINGVIDIKASNEKNTDEIRILVDKEKAAQYGLNNITVAQSIQGYFRAINIDEISLDNKIYSITLATTISDNANYSDLENITITNINGSKIPLSNIAKIERGKGYNEISRKNDSRVVTVSAGIDGTSIEEAVKETKNILSTYEIPSGYRIKYGGEIEQMIEAFSQMALALVVAILLVYMVMAAQFESLLNPFIIMFTIPLAFIGAVLLLFVTGVNIGITAFIGFIMLSGIIVNNGIVLIDYINKLKNEGKSTREAILETGPVRLQPILMTALTTIIGLVPMALGFGEGSELQLPLALTVIGGLSFSTILTLIIIPVLYEVFDSLSMKFKKVKIV